MILKTNKGIEFVIDDEDYILVKDKSFYCVSNNTGQFYIRITNNKKVVGLHRYLLGVTDPKLFVDHIDGNTFNNSKSNLRIVTAKQSQHNTGRKMKANSTSKYKGVRFRYRKYPLKKPWQCYISFNGKTKHLGYFKTEEEAAEVYNKYALQFFGEYARLNKIEGK